MADPRVCCACGELTYTGSRCTNCGAGPEEQEELFRAGWDGSD